jgi:hypothetical protein
MKQHGTAGIAEDVLDAFFLQTAHNDLCAVNSMIGPARFRR